MGWSRDKDNRKRGKEAKLVSGMRDGHPRDEVQEAIIITIQL